MAQVTGYRSINTLRQVYTELYPKQLVERDFSLFSKRGYMTDLVKNAIEAIEMGIEDYESNDPKRPSSAVRNYYSGVLLLGKACLLNAAPNANPMEVIGSKFVPRLDGNGGVIYVVSGQNTIDVNSLQSRFKDFGIKWPKGDFKNLHQLRNNIEHLHTNKPKDQIKEVIANSFPLVEGFFKLLAIDPALEINEVWLTILKAKSDIDEKKEHCNSSFNNLPWFAELHNLDQISCGNCGSSLINQKDIQNDDPAEINAICLNCNQELGAEQTVEMIVDAEKAGEDYVSRKDTGDGVIHQCPECGNNTYISDGESELCFFCAFEASGECAVCSQHLTVHDGGDSMCSSCQYTLDKAMAE